MSTKKETFIYTCFYSGINWGGEIVVDVTVLYGGLKRIKKSPSLCLSSFVSSRCRLIYVTTQRDFLVYLLSSKGYWWKPGLVVFKRDAMQEIQ